MFISSHLELSDFSAFRAQVTFSSCPKVLPALSLPIQIALLNQSWNIVYLFIHSFI